MMIGPVPDRRVPIYSGGHSTVALRRAARYSDGWVGNAYPWDEAEHHIGRLKGFLAEEGRADDDFEIIIGLYDAPSVDLYRRAGDELGVTGMMCMPWATLQNVSTDQREGLLQKADAYRAAIDEFAEEFVQPLAEG